MSRYTINWDKSELMPLLTNLSPAFLKTSPFKLVTNLFAYLGLKISRDPKLLMKLIFLNMVDKLHTNIKNWNLLPFSIIGGINAIKMVLVPLPKSSYLFTTVFLQTTGFNHSLICVGK